MNCNWMNTYGLDAADKEWEEHVRYCAECQVDFEMDAFDQNAALDAYYRMDIPPSISIVDRVMEEIETLETVPASLLVGGSQSVPCSPRRRNRSFGLWTAAAAIVILTLGTALHVPIAKAMNDVIDEIDTTLFPRTSQPIKVKLQTVPPEKSQQVQEELLSPNEVSQAKVFEAHKQEIISTYNQLPMGASFGMKFADGTGFDVVKEPVYTSVDSFEQASKGFAPVLQDLPDALSFDRGTVRFGGDGTSLGEINMLFTPNHVTTSKEFEYQKYTNEAFSLEKGTYLTVNLVFADGILATEYTGDFTYKQSVTVQGSPGVLMQYSESWRPEPGITVLSFGVRMQGHNYTVQLSGRNIKPEEMLEIGETMKFTQTK